MGLTPLFSDCGHNRMLATLLAAPDYLRRPADTQILWEEDLGYAEPIIDRSRWQRDHILTLLLQHNQKTNDGISHKVINYPITLLDIRFD